MNQSVMFKLSYGLFILTAKENGFDNGSVINTAQQLTDSPNRISVTVNKNGKTHDITKGINSYISAKVIQEIDLGTHTLFIADVTDGEMLSDAPSATYAYYHSHIKPKPENKKITKTVWRCKVCGYEYVGEELPDDFICPLCKHPKSDFEKIEVTE